MAFRVHLCINYFVLAWFEIIELDCFRTLRSLRFLEHFFILGLIGNFFYECIALF
jgi:hypothetical protein